MPLTCVVAEVISHMAPHGRPRLSTRRIAKYAHMIATGLVNPPDVIDGRRVFMITHIRVRAALDELERGGDVTRTQDRGGRPTWDTRA